jgi:alpha-beta hydrolase superfamily lysophospholipase
VGERGAGVRRLLHLLPKAGLTTVSSKSYDDARHELVHETNREGVMRDLVAWLLTNLLRGSR